MLYRIDAVTPLEGYRIWIRFQNGVKGEVDLSDLAGKGVFHAWDEPGFFQRVFVDERSGTVAWPGGLDLAPDALYEDVAGITTS